jgi:hypothetical protein
MPAMPATLANYAVETLGLLLPALALVAAWWVLRSKATPMEAGAGLDGLLAGGAPVVVELFDNG